MFDGQLSLDFVDDEFMNRQVRRARLTEQQGRKEGDVLPPLFDAQVNYMQGNVMRVSGWVRDDLSHKHEMQVWEVKLVL